MPYEQLIESVEKCAEDKIRGVTEKAIQDAEKIKAEAKGKDEIIKKEAPGRGQKNGGQREAQITGKNQ